MSRQEFQNYQQQQSAQSFKQESEYSIYSKVILGDGIPYIKENGKTIKDMAKVFKYIQMVLFLKEFGKIIELLEKQQKLMVTQQTVLLKIIKLFRVQKPYYKKTQNIYLINNWRKFILQKKQHNQYKQIQSFNASFQMELNMMDKYKMK
ncbi:unnamed protein product [Paramecium primaurelia]|uniref:Uncharacterized protein n=1 Tax=Paramecium primaurelia TaxID=5886 RepID=A0A8S1PIG9_PARPR|nr:unnamed protein product [Paramecium primaurelia]